VLTILSAKLCGYTGGNRHIRLAAAIEFIHSATLLHDDVVDESELRRGEKTANNLWGNAASVLVGDFLLSRAFQLMSRDGSLRVMKLLSDSSAIISEGEVWQLMATADLATTKETYLKIIAAKTAQLFAAATAVGPLITERPEEEVAALDHFGRALGIAFQIVDDTLDYSARQEEIGKTIGDDFREGKVTLPVLFAYAKADAGEKEFWERVIVRREQKAGDLEQAVSLMQKHRVLAEVMEEARRYAEKAQEHLAPFPPSEEKQALLDLADFAVSRPF
jgi:octaprenyl-diphosphate synthase